MKHEQYGLSYRLELPCDLRAVRPAIQAVQEFLSQQGLDAAHSLACRLALTEACNNAIEHAAPAQRDQPIGLEALWEPTEVVLRVQDQTAGFSWGREVTLPAMEAEEGRGLFLIRSCVDAVEYLRGEGRNCLVMRKKLPPVPGSLPDEGSNCRALVQRVGELDGVIQSMAGELSACYESLATIFRCGERQPRPEEALAYARRFLENVRQLTETEWYALRLIAREGDGLTLFVSSDPELELGAIALPAVETGAETELEAIRQRQMVWFEGSNPFAHLVRPGSLEGGAVGVATPFFANGALIGLLVLGRKAPAAPLTAGQANLADTLGRFLVMQLLNARSEEDHVRDVLFARDLEIARDIQRSLFPGVLPRLPGLDLAGYWQSAQRVGGDYCDALEYDERGLLLVIADVMGKGIPAAIFAAVLRGMVRALPGVTARPSAMLAQLNQMLFQELSAVDMFITMQLVLVDMEAQRLTVASAGHCPGLLAWGEDSRVEPFSTEGVPLGVLRGAAFLDRSLPLGQGWRLLLYTDGLPEARNPHGETFGQRRLVEWLSGATEARHSAGAMRDELVTRLAAFQREAPLLDDQSFLVLAG